MFEMASLASRIAIGGGDVSVLCAARITKGNHRNCQQNRNEARSMRSTALNATPRFLPIAPPYALRLSPLSSLDAMSSEAALQELRGCAGSQFDPSFVEAFVESFRRELSGHTDLDIFLARDAEEFEYVRARGRMEASLKC